MNVEDLIYTVPDAFSDELCDHCIEYHTTLVEQNIATAGETGYHVEGEELPKVSIDCRYGVAGTNYDTATFNKMNQILINHWWGYGNYFNSDDFKLTDTFGIWPRTNYDHLQIQLYKKNEGHYNAWHTDNDYQFPYQRREYVYTVYLNDVEDGGETEFIFGTKVKPEKGKLMFFPCNFPFVHRGNMPESNDKYILTGWVCESSPIDACAQFQEELIRERQNERKKG